MVRAQTAAFRDQAVDPSASPPGAGLILLILCVSHTNGAGLPEPLASIGYSLHPLVYCILRTLYHLEP